MLNVLASVKVHDPTHEEIRYLLDTHVPVPLLAETIEVLREQLEDQHAAFLKDKDNVKRRCDELRERADLELDELLTDLRALAACAVSSRTGRTMQPEEVETQLAALKRKEEEVAQLRLQYIKLKNRYTKEDEALRSKVLPLHDTKHCFIILKWFSISYV